MKIKDLDKEKISGIGKIVKLNNKPEMLTRSDGKFYGMSFYFFTAKFHKVPLKIRVLCKNSGMTNVHAIEVFNKQMKPVFSLDVKDDISDKALITIFSKLPELVTFKKIKAKMNESYKGIDSYLNYLEEQMLGGLPPDMPKGVVIFYMIYFGLAFSLLAYALVSYYIKKIRNLTEEYQSAGPREQAINEKLFKGQKYNESAFDIYVKLQNFIKYVALGKAPAVILCGPPGTSKTYIVRRVMHFENLKPGQDYVIEKGGSLTLGGVYDLLYRNRNRILILDDFDTPLENPNTVNMLKAITDSYDKRILSISRTQMMASGQTGDDYDSPSKFEYKGKLIIITNLLKKDLDRALLSRCPTFEVSFSGKEIVDALNKLLVFICPEVNIKIKQEVLDYIMELKKTHKDIQLDFRAFKNAVDARVGNPYYWKDMVHTIVGID